MVALLATLKIEGEMAMGKLLSLPEVASRTSTSIAFWRKVIGRKEVPVVKIGRLTRLREEDVEAFCRLGLRQGDRHA